MTILRERRVWRRERPDAAADQSKLTAEERASVVRALRRIQLQYGSWARLAVALMMKPDTLSKIARRGRGHASIACLMEAPLGDVLTGAFVRRGVCPTCGRCAAQPPER